MLRRQQQWSVQVIPTKEGTTQVVGKAIILSLKSASVLSATSQLTEEDHLWQSRKVHSGHVSNTRKQNIRDKFQNAGCFETTEHYSV